LASTLVSPAGDFGRPYLNAALGFNPSAANNSMSSLKAGFGVVSNLSPAKIEFAPAKKHKACASALIDNLPADKRTADFGITIRVTATIRTISQTGTAG
jgi:hypothetical protein